MKHSRPLRVHWLACSLLYLLVLSLGGCQGRTTATDTAPEISEAMQEVVKATGEVVPAKEATLSFAIPGNVSKLLVEVGDSVQAGEMIAQLETDILDAEVARAEAALAIAQANLSREKNGPRETLIAEAKNNLSASSAATVEATAQRDILTAGASDAEISAAKAEVQRAFIAVIEARTQHDYLQDVITNIDDYSLKIQFTYTQDLVDDAHEQYTLALQNLDAAQAYLDHLQAGPNPDKLRVAEAQVWAASAEYQAALAQLNLLEVGPRPENVALAEAQVGQAKAGLDRALVARENAAIVVPFGGTICEVYIRESQYVNPGEPIVLLADLSGLHVETTDLNEIDVAKIAVDDSAIITFDALPDLNVVGKVTNIAPKSSTGTGVNFTVVLALAEVPEAIRWGMTAFVDIPVE